MQTKKSKTIKRKKERIKEAKGKQKKTRYLEANLLSMQRHFLTSAKHTRHLFRKWKTTSAVLANGSIAPIPTEKKSKNRREMAKTKLSATKTKTDTKKNKETKFRKMNESGDTVDTESKHVEKRSGMHEVDVNQPHIQATVKARWQQTSRQK